MKPAPFRYHAPKTVSEAVAILTEVAPDDGRVLAGGQSLVPTMAFRLARPAHLIDINGIASLQQIVREGNRVRVGACVRHAAFYENVVEGTLGALLREVVNYIGHHPIRTRGTFCGSLAHADPASEWCTVAVGLGADLVAVSQSGRRVIAARDFFTGIMSTALKPEELLAEAQLPILPPDTRFGFNEFSRRPGDFAIAMALVTYRLQNGTMQEARVTIGGAEATPRRISEGEAALNGEKPTQQAFRAAADAAASAVEPLEDFNYSADYRRDLVRTLTRRALERAAA